MGPAKSVTDYSDAVIREHREPSMEYSFLRNKTTFAAVVGVLALVSFIMASRKLREQIVS